MPALQWRIELRNFRKYLASNLLIIGLLGVGLAATLVIFGFLKALVFDPAPFPNRAQIDRIGLVTKESADSLDSPQGKLVLQWQQAFENQAKPEPLPWFAIAMGTINIGANIQSGQAPERVDGAFVMGSIWTQLGVVPKLGRDFSAADFKPGMPPVVILGDALWRTRFQANPNILGESVRINGQAATVIAVMPANMSFPKREVLWTQANLTGAQSEYGFEVFLRSENKAARSAQLAALQNQFLLWQQNEPNGADYLQVGSQALSDWFVGFEIRTMAGVMFAAVCLLLFAVCMNAASVLLVRLYAEQSQNALRLALGSGWLPLAMSALVQSLLLAGCGAVLADGLSIFAGNHIMAMFDNSAQGFPLWVDFSATVSRWHLFGFALVGALLTAALPIWRLRKLSLSGALRQSGRSVTSTQVTARALVFVQVCLSCIVVACAGVVVSQIQTVIQRPVGVDGSNLLTARLGLFEQSYPNATDVDRFRAELLAKLNAQAGVESVSFSTALPADMSDRERVQSASQAAADSLETYTAYIDEHFLKTYRISLLAGRDFQAQDMQRTETGALTANPCSMLIDTQFAGTLGGNSQALGQLLTIDPETPDAKRCTIIGVVNHVELNQLDGDRLPGVLLPISQQSGRFLSIAIKLRSNSQAFKPALVQAVSSVNPDQPVYWLRTFDEVLKTTSAGNRVLSLLFSGLSMIALALSAAGLYGLLSFQSEQRRTEVGLRMALGASTLDVLHALFARSFLLVLIGVVCGSLLAIFPAKTLASFVSDEGARWSSMLVVLALFSITTLVAAIKPALRAMRVSPQEALRGE
jgi:putative ABC transport system permease protein